MAADEQDKDRNGEADGPVCGERLRAGRRANDISVSDVAKELHLDESKVRALEKNDFAVLGAPVFAKGHLRKYAEMVGVDVREVIGDYYELTRADGMPPVVGEIRKRRRDIDATPWVVGILVAMGVAAVAYWWFAVRESAIEPAAGRIAMPADAADTAAEADDEPAGETTPAVESDRETPQPEPESTAGEQESPDVSSPSDGGQPSTEAASAPGTPVDAAPQAPAPQPASGAAEIEPAVVTAPADASRLAVTLAFTGECWAEVTDATGARLFYDLGTAGRTSSFAGVPPLRLVLGDVDAVTITVDGEPYTVPASVRRGQLATFSLVDRP